MGFCARQRDCSAGLGELIVIHLESYLFFKKMYQCKYQASAEVPSYEWLQTVKELMQILRSSRNWLS